MVSPGFIAQVDGRTTHLSVGIHHITFVISERRQPMGTMADDLEERFVDFNDK
jgi:hypothetical protein